ncbi:hypothetical protein Cni_G12964 [Canna indica]|uniref:Uncharacterized protein n=1 Tax=Canna indica TaxID=4628 RepID=A0AAQ3QCP2_9LILI|nr:hypothetical protein Cni_G12964 [Canna indica]
MAPWAGSASDKTEGKRMGQLREATVANHKREQWREKEAKKRLREREEIGGGGEGRGGDLAGKVSPFQAVLKHFGEINRSDWSEGP